MGFLAGILWDCSIYGLDPMRLQDLWKGSRGIYGWDPTRLWELWLGFHGIWDLQLESHMILGFTARASLRSVEFPKAF